MIPLECPSCGVVNEPGHLHNEESQSLLVCSNCHQFYVVSGFKISYVYMDNQIPTVKVKIPELAEGTDIYMIYEEHPRYLDPASIIGRDHLHYRIQFADGMRLWVPPHWVIETPEELQ